MNRRGRWLAVIVALAGGLGLLLYFVVRVSIVKRLPGRE